MVHQVGFEPTILSEYGPEPYAYAVPPLVQKFEERGFYIIHPLMGKKADKKQEKSPPPAISNRKARHSYEIFDSFEAGIVLQGPEVKSLRDGKASLQDSFARIEKGEVFLYHMHITPYSYAHHLDLNPTRTRKLLMHRAQINKLSGKVQEKGYTLVPLEVFFNKSGIAKVNLALARGKRGPDKRESIKKRDQEREARREFQTRTKF
jgi:SsrA-binding protein